MKTKTEPKHGYNQEISLGNIFPLLISLLPVLIIYFMAQTEGIGQFKCIIIPFAADFDL